MHPANEKWHYNVTLSLIGWAHSQNDPWQDSPQAVCYTDEIHTDGLGQDCSISSALTMEILQSWTELLIWYDSQSKHSVSLYIVLLWWYHGSLWIHLLHWRWGSTCQRNNPEICWKNSREILHRTAVTMTTFQLESPMLNLMKTAERSEWQLQREIVFTLIQMFPRYSLATKCARKFSLQSYQPCTLPVPYKYKIWSKFSHPCASWHHSTWTE